MTITKMQERNGKSQALKVFKVGDNEFHVESSEGKISYRVSLVLIT